MIVLDIMAFIAVVLSMIFIIKTYFSTMEIIYGYFHTILFSIITFILFALHLLILGAILKS